MFQKDLFVSSNANKSLASCFFNCSMYIFISITPSISTNCYIFFLINYFPAIFASVTQQIALLDEIGEMGYELNSSPLLIEYKRQNQLQIVDIFVSYTIAEIFVLSLILFLAEDDVIFPLLSYPKVFLL